MKKLLVALVLIAALVVPAQASKFCMWTLASADNITARAGYALDENIEAGLESSWRTDSGKPGQIWGIYGVYKSPDMIDFDKIFTNDWIPSLKGTPYVGASMSVDFANTDDKRSIAGPLAGIILQDILVVEYFYQFPRDDLGGLLEEGYTLRIGLHLEF